MADAMADSTDELMVVSKVVWEVMKQAFLLAELVVMSMADSTNEWLVVSLAVLSDFKKAVYSAGMTADSKAAQKER